MTILTSQIIEQLTQLRYLDLSENDLNGKQLLTILASLTNSLSRETIEEVSFLYNRPDRTIAK